MKMGFLLMWIMVQVSEEQEERLSWSKKVGHFKIGIFSKERGTRKNSDLSSAYQYLGHSNKNCSISGKKRPLRESVRMTRAERSLAPRPRARHRKRRPRVQRRRHPENVDVDPDMESFFEWSAIGGGWTDSSTERLYSFNSDVTTNSLSDLYKFNDSLEKPFRKKYFKKRRKLKKTKNNGGYYNRRNPYRVSEFESFYKSLTTEENALESEVMERVENDKDEGYAILDDLIPRQLQEYLTTTDRKLAVKYLRKESNETSIKHLSKNILRQFLDNLSIDVRKNETKYKTSTTECTTVEDTTMSLSSCLLKQIGKLPYIYDKLEANLDRITDIPNILNSIVDDIEVTATLNIRNILNAYSTMSPIIKNERRLNKEVIDDRLEYIKGQLALIVTSKLGLYETGKTCPKASRTRARDPICSTRDKKESTTTARVRRTRRTTPTTTTCEEDYDLDYDTTYTETTCTSEETTKHVDREYNKHTLETSSPKTRRPTCRTTECTRTSEWEETSTAQCTTRRMTRCTCTSRYTSRLPSRKASRATIQVKINYVLPDELKTSPAPLDSPHYQKPQINVTFIVNKNKQHGSKSKGNCSSSPAGSLAETTFNAANTRKYKTNAKKHRPINHKKKLMNVVDSDYNDIISSDECLVSGRPCSKKSDQKYFPLISNSNGSILQKTFDLLQDSLFTNPSSTCTELFSVQAISQDGTEINTNDGVISKLRCNDKNCCRLKVPCFCSKASSSDSAHRQSQPSTESYPHKERHTEHIWTKTLDQQPNTLDEDELITTSVSSRHSTTTVKISYLNLLNDLDSDLNLNTSENSTCVSSQLNSSTHFNLDLNLTTTENSTTISPQHLNLSTDLNSDVNLITRENSTSISPQHLNLSTDLNSNLNYNSSQLLSTVLPSKFEYNLNSKTFGAPEATRSINNTIDFNQLFAANGNDTKILIFTVCMAPVSPPSKTEKHETFVYNNNPGLRKCSIFDRMRIPFLSKSYCAKTRSPPKMNEKQYVEKAKEPMPLRSQKNNPYFILPYPVSQYNPWGFYGMQNPYLPYANSNFPHRPLSIQTWSQPAMQYFPNNQPVFPYNRPTGNTPTFPFGKFVVQSAVSSVDSSKADDVDRISNDYVDEAELLSPLQSDVELEKLHCAQENIDLFPSANNSRTVQGQKTLTRDHINIGNTNNDTNCLTGDSQDVNSISVNGIVSKTDDLNQEEGSKYEIDLVPNILTFQSGNEYKEIDGDEELGILTVLNNSSMTNKVDSSLVEQIRRFVRHLVKKPRSNNIGFPIEEKDKILIEDLKGFLTFGNESVSGTSIRAKTEECIHSPYQRRHRRAPMLSENYENR